MKITFIGGGNMAQAIAGGLIRNGFEAQSICAVEPLPEARARLESQFGVRAGAAAAQAAPLGDLIVMAVKPQQMRLAAGTIGALAADSLVLSIAAGTRLADLQRWLGGHALLARCMPNTPARLGQGVVAICAGSSANLEALAQVRSLLEPLGRVVDVAEPQMDAFTAVAGCGPAYVLLFLQALGEAAQAVGFSVEDARAVALQVVLGTAELARVDGRPVETLRAEVTSKGGVTQAAVAVLQAQSWSETLVQAVQAGVKRSVELSSN